MASGGMKIVIQSFKNFFTVIRYNIGTNLEGVLIWKRL